MPQNPQCIATIFMYRNSASVNNRKITSLSALTGRSVTPTYPLLPNTGWWRSTPRCCPDASSGRWRAPCRTRARPPETAWPGTGSGTRLEDAETDRTGGHLQQLRLQVLQRRRRPPWGQVRVLWNLKERSFVKVLERQERNIQPQAKYG